MNQLDQRYLTTFIGGEAAYNWGNWERQPGVDPSASVRDTVHRNFVINAIKWLHCTQLRWIHAYDDQDPDTQRVQSSSKRRWVIALLSMRQRLRPTLLTENYRYRRPFGTKVQRPLLRLAALGGLA